MKAIGCVVAVVVVLGIVVLAMLGIYNNLVGLAQAVDAQWAQVENTYQRRSDLIPNLVATVSGSANFEKSTLEAVISARARAVGATGVAATARAEGELTQALGKLFALAENYPDLKSSANVLQLQEELSSTENKIGFARQLFNDVATQYNTKQAQFPTNFVAGLAKATPSELWEITDAGERLVPTVDLSLNRPAS